MANKFIWLHPDPQLPRPGRGPKVEKGKTYDVKDFSPDVVAEWIRTGFAEYEEEESKPAKSKKTGGE